MDLLRTACLVLLCIVLVGCSDNDSVTCPPNDPPPSTYPTTMEPLDEVEIAEIERAFAERNPGVSVSLDEYGLPNLRSLCVAPDEPGVSESAAKEIARNFLDRNRDFFHIEQDSDLRVRAATRYGGDRWVILFANQTYRGVEVLDTGIRVWVAQSVYCAQRTNYSDIYVPEAPLVSADVAFCQLPKSIPFQCWTTIWVDVVYDSEMLIVPLMRGDPIRGDSTFELRVVWKFPLNDGHYDIGQVHVDTMTGEELQTIWHIVC